MTRLRHVALPVGAALIAVLAVAGCKKKDAATDTTATVPPASTTLSAPAPMPTTTVATPASTATTASVVAVELGSAAGADMRITAPKSTFAVRDKIIVAVTTRAPDAATGASKLGAKWTHVDSNQTVNEESRDITLQGEQVYDFEITNPDAWPTGKYRVEVSLDGKPVQSRDFEVR